MARCDRCHCQAKITYTCDLAPRPMCGRCFRSVGCLTNHPTDCATMGVEADVPEHMAATARRLLGQGKTYAP